jgi:hypothetical protein
MPFRNRNYLVSVAETNLYKNLVKFYVKKACPRYHGINEKPMRKEQAYENKIHETTIHRFLI